MKQKIAIVIGTIIAILTALTGWAVATEHNTIVPVSDTRTSEGVVVREQTRIVTLSCMSLTSALVQVRYRAIDEDFTTPWTDWRTVRMLEYYAHPEFPECQDR